MSCRSPSTLHRPEPPGSRAHAQTSQRSPLRPWTAAQRAGTALGSALGRQACHGPRDLVPRARSRPVSSHAAGQVRCWRCRVASPRVASPQCAALAPHGPRSFRVRLRCPCSVTSPRPPSASHPLCLNARLLGARQTGPLPAAPAPSPCPARSPRGHGVARRVRRGASCGRSLLAFRGFILSVRSTCSRYGAPSSERLTYEPRQLVPCHPRPRLFPSVVTPRRSREAPEPSAANADEARGSD